MSFVGIKFHGRSDSRIPITIRRNYSDERLDAWIAEQEERNRVVEVCQICNRELIAEEVEAHRLSHLSPKVRRIAGMTVRLSEAQRSELLEYLAE